MDRSNNLYNNQQETNNEIESMFHLQADQDQKQEIDKDLMNQFEQFQMQQIDMGKLPSKAVRDEFEKQENLSQESSSDSTNNTNNLSNTENIQNKINNEIQSPEPKKSHSEQDSPNSDNLFKSPTDIEYQNPNITDDKSQNLFISEVKDINLRKSLNEEIEDLKFKPIKEVLPRINSQQNQILKNLRYKGENTESNGSKTDSDIDSSGSNPRDSIDSNRDSSENTDIHQNKRINKQQLKCHPSSEQFLKGQKATNNKIEISSKLRKQNSESSNTSDDEEADVSNSDPSEKDSSSGDSMDDGFDKDHKLSNLKYQRSNKISIKQFSKSKDDGFRLEGTLNESDLNQENSNSANENSAENNLENYEVDIETADSQEIDCMQTYRDRQQKIHIRF